MPTLWKPASERDAFQALVIDALDACDSMRDERVPYTRDIDWIVRAREDVTLVLWTVERKTSFVVPLHHHVETQAGIVRDGSIVLSFADGMERTVRAGECYTLASNLPHGLRLEEPAVIFEIYHPRRIEYEEQFAYAVRARDFGR